MRGVLKPPAQGRDAYSQVIPLQDNNAYYINGQYPQQPQQSPAQQSQSNTWPADPETPYYPSAAAYGTPSTQYSNQNNGGYPSVEQSPSAPQTSQYHGYDARSNSYTYPEPAQATTPYVQQRPGASVDPESPEQSSTPKHDRMLYGQRYQNTVQDLEELMERLQVEIDASFVDGVHECCKTELTLGGNAFVPLMRPNIGPYADGGKQDLPAEFKKNFPSEVAKEKEPSQEDSQAETQTQSQDEPQPNTDAAPTTQEGNGASETQQPATSSASKQTPTRPTVTEPEDPLKLCPRATVDTILNIDDPDLRAIIQRAASRGLVQRIVNLDGYKYMFNNYWQSRVDGDGMRYSYICRDSLQNKDRFSHVPARATTTAPSHRHLSTPRRTKESWDCKGSLSIKFSSNANASLSSIAIRLYIPHTSLAKSHHANHRCRKLIDHPRSRKPRRARRGSAVRNLQVQRLVFRNQCRLQGLRRESRVCSTCCSRALLRVRRTRTEGSWVMLRDPGGRILERGSRPRV
jgi:hypothetical protein